MLNQSPTVDYVIDVLAKKCLIKENWRELERLEDSVGSYRSLIVGVQLTGREKCQVNKYFNSTRFYFDFKDMAQEGEYQKATVIKIRIDKD